MAIILSRPQCVKYQYDWDQESMVKYLVIFSYTYFLAWPWWRHQMETFSPLLAICAGNSPVPGEFPTQRPVTQSFDIYFDLRPNKRLSKRSWGWWFETLSPPLWRHRNASPCLGLLILKCVSFGDVFGKRGWTAIQFISQHICADLVTSYHVWSRDCRQIAGIKQTDRVQGQIYRFTTCVVCVCIPCIKRSVMRLSSDPDASRGSPP